MEEKISLLAYWYNRLRCWLGIHRCRYEAMPNNEYYPLPTKKRIVVYRECCRCGKLWVWLKKEGRQLWICGDTGDKSASIYDRVVVATKETR
jgi:hypothetical protein